jgi:hypothetical protein
MSERTPISLPHRRRDCVRTVRDDPIAAHSASSRSSLCADGHSIKPSANRPHDPSRGRGHLDQLSAPLAAAGLGRQGGFVRDIRASADGADGADTDLPNHCLAIRWWRGATR